MKNALLFTSQKSLECKNEREKTFLIIHYYSKIHCIHAQWIGFASEQDLINGCLQILELAQQTQASSYLDDDRQLVGPQNTFVPWFEEEFLPMAVKSSIKHVAHLHAEDLYALLSFEELEAAISAHFHFKSFYNEKEAFKWLQSLSKR
jgi:hypothetical protein